VWLISATYISHILVCFFFLIYFKPVVVVGYSIDIESQGVLLYIFAMKKISLFFIVTSCLSSVALADISAVDILSQQRSGASQYSNPISSAAASSGTAGVKVNISTFKLQDVQVVGNGSLSDESLREVFNKYIGQEINSSKASELLKEVKSLYKQEGLLLPVVTVSQGNGGVLIVNVVEGKIRDVALSVPDAYEKAVYDNSLITKYIDKILASSPARTKDVQRYLQLLNKIPGYTFQYELKPITSGNKADNDVADMLLSVERKRVDLNLDANNYGSDDIGRYQFSASTGIYNLLGWNDSLIAGYTTTNRPERLKSVYAGYLKRLNSYGTSASVMWSYSLDNGFSSGSKDNNTNDVKGQISQYLILNNKNSVRLDVGVDYRTAKQHAPGVVLDTYEYFQGFVGGKMKHKDFLGADNFLDPYVYFTLGDAHLTSAPGAITNFGKHFSSVKVNYYRDQPLFGNFSAFSRVSWSGTQDQLPPEQQFFVDGVNIGRGYKPGIAYSNTGINGDIELRYTYDVEKKFLDTAQLFAFYDISHFSKQQVAISHDTLNAAGIGTRLYFPYGIRGEFEIDFPFTRKLTVGGLTQNVPTRYQFLVGKSFSW